MKNTIIILFISFLTMSCSVSREKDIDELLLSEFVYETNGIYYQHAVNHKKVKYSGTLKFYHFENGKLKGKVIIENGIPEGLWEYWYENGSKKLDLYFENGIVTRKVKTEKDNLKIAETVSEKQIKKSKQENNPIDSLWNDLVFEKGGCLAGGQNFQKGQTEREGQVLNKKEWKTFLSKPKKELTEFLITKFTDTTKTKIHTCPFFGATNGEIAVYALQKVHNKNWFDFREFKKYKNKETTSATDNRQSWLLKILKNNSTRKVLTDCWLKELNKK